MKIAYIDVETTGVDRQKDSIWQLAGIIQDGEKQEEFNFKIAPYNVNPCSLEALKIGGVTIGELRQFPSAKTVYQEFSDLITSYVSPFDKTDKLYFCGYNAGFDGDFVRNFFKINGDKYYGSYFWYPELDVMQLASWYFAGQRHLIPDFRLQTVYRYVTGKELEGAHDAMEDIRATKVILNYLIENFGMFDKRG